MYQKFMLAAIEEAKKGRGKTYTNPLVGAAIVKDERIIALGAHLSFGEAHAEVNAISRCQTPEDLFHSTLYVTLEPCNHQGKQPPCMQAIVAAGIKKVVIGQLDPNPLVAGQGVAFLQKQGVQVIVGVATAACRELNPFYNYFYENKRPYIVLKQAISLDGRIARQEGMRTFITGPEAILRVRKERAAYQGIVVGSETVLVDNPSLLPDAEMVFPPVRIILDRRGRLFKETDLNLFKTATSPVWIFTENFDSPELPEHVTIFKVAKFSLSYFMEELRTKGIQSLYVEGGGNIHDAFLAENLWEEVITYLAPKLFGGTSPFAFQSSRICHQEQILEIVAVEQVGEDLRIRGENHVYRFNYWKRHH